MPTESDGALEPEIVAFVTGLPTFSMEDFLSASESCPELAMLRSQVSQSWPKNSRELDPVLVPLVASDGCSSAIRSFFLPELQNE